MLEITNIRQGAILNHNHGKEEADGLTVRFEGISDYPGPVTLNGQPTFRDGRLFSANIKLTEKINTVTAASESAFGNFSQSIKVVWDKKSFKRTNCYIDDHSFFWTDLARERPKRAFDHFYLKNLKEIHNRCGFKVTLNCFYHNDHFDCNITEVPDTWKQEFIDNSDWLKLSFHSKGEFPDRLYIETPYEEFANDYDMTRDEIIRFAGEETFIAPVVIHWAMISPGCVKALQERGVKAYATAFRPRLMGGPSASARAAGNTSNQMDKYTESAKYEALMKFASDFAVDEHYSNIEENSYLSNHRCFYNPRFDITFFRGGCCCNLLTKEVIKERLQGILDSSAAVGNEFFNFGSHEQYSFPYYHNYIPDHDERIGVAAQYMADAGCEFVFFSEGFMGNKAWD